MQDLRYRWASTSDIPELMVLAKKFYNASPYSHLPYSDNKIAEIFRTALGFPSPKTFLMLADDTRIAGFLMGVANQLVFNEENLALEVALWVEPAYRNQKVAQNLRGGYEYWARSIANCSMVELTALADDRLPAVTRLYKSWGYAPAEHHYLKRL